MNTNKKPVSHHSLYYKNEFPDMYVPVPLRTTITFRLFPWNKLSIKIRTGWLFIKKKFTKPEKSNKTKTPKRKSGKGKK